MSHVGISMKLLTRKVACVTSMIMKLGWICSYDLYSWLVFWDLCPGDTISRVISLLSNLSPNPQKGSHKASQPVV